MVSGRGWIGLVASISLDGTVTFAHALQCVVGILLILGSFDPRGWVSFGAGFGASEPIPLTKAQRVVIFTCGLVILLNGLYHILG
jgi:hypothetical protein